MVCVVGDLHGDLSKARDALQIAGVLSSDGQDQWIGEDTVCPPFYHHLPHLVGHNFSLCYISSTTETEFEFGALVLQDNDMFI